MEAVLAKLGKIGFNWKMALFNLINFLILFFILKRYFFDAVLNNIEEREQRINKGVEDAKKAETELRMAKRKAQDIIDEAKVDANQIIEDAKEDAEAVAKDMKQEAKEEIDSLVSQAKRNIARDREEMKENLRRETISLAMEAAEKVVEKELDKEADEKFIKEMLATKTTN